MLGEALRLLAETRARALELCAEVNRRQGGATPDVHDFNLPTIIELQRRPPASREPAKPKPKPKPAEAQAEAEAEAEAALERPHYQDRCPLRATPPTA